MKILLKFFFLFLFVTIKAMSETIVDQISAEQLTAEAWQWFESVGKPKYWLAPMVGQSECAFRMLSRKYGATMCSTEVRI
jgi:hypothetical protein